MKFGERLELIESGLIDQQPVDEASLATYMPQPLTNDAKPLLSKRSQPKIGSSFLMPNPLRDALSLIRGHRKEFILVNAAFFGLFAATMTVTLLNPEIQPAILDAISGIVRTDLAVKVYLSGNLFYAASATFAVNLGIAGMLISIPSFLVPFFGVVFAMVFAAAYGVTLAPIGPYAATMIPHSIAVLIEFQAYIVAAFGAYLTGCITLLPVAGEKRSVGQGYRAAAAQVLSLYALVVPLLFLGAVYEAFEIIYLVGYFI